MPAIRQAPGGCGCGGTCPVNFNVKGNNSLQLGGAVATIWTDSTKATQLGTATTDCSGLATVAIPPGAFYWEVSHPSGRLTKTTGSSTCSGTGRTINTTLSTITAGYYGLNWCPLPMPATLYYSDTFTGTVTLTYTAGNWVGTKSVTYPAGTDKFGNACTASTQAATYTLVGAGSGTMSVSYKHISATCGSCAGTATATACTGSAAATCSGGVYPIAVSWLARYINPTDATAYAGTVTE